MALSRKAAAASAALRSGGPLAGRLERLGQLVLRSGYRSPSKGGLGPRSIVKDATVGLAHPLPGAGRGELVTRLHDSMMSRPATRRLLSRTIYGGRAVECTCCRATFRCFAPFMGRPDRACWVCGAVERHRQLGLLFDRRPELLRPGQRVLHLAPEPALRRMIERATPSAYVTADLEAPGVDMHFDLTAAPIPESSFDVIICNHVLEHIPDDRAALREIRRMLTPDGWALVMTPIVVSRTDEDPSVTDPQERLRRFGQVDHVRRYGWDYVERLREAGMSVEVLRLEEDLPDTAVERYRLRNVQGFVEPIFLTRRTVLSGG